MRTTFQIFALLLLGGLAAQKVGALEVNYWPLFTAQPGEQEGETEGSPWQSVGPIVFWETDAEGEVHGVRPFFVRFVEEREDRSSVHVLYPLFNARYRPYGTSWDVFSLLRYQAFVPEGEEATRTFHLFPIIFWGDSPDPEQSYFGVFPIAGQLHNILTYDEITWFLFPLTARLVRGETTTFAMPWPFVRFVRGPRTRGFHLWPLYGQVEREGVSSHRYWLWPLGYRVRGELGKEQPYEASGFLPFYSFSDSERAVSRTIIWPFFGYTDSREPEYLEKRYFYPLFVQRRGDSYINRWAPFYTRSIRSGVDKQWVMWPFYRHSTWDDRGLMNDRTQFLYFLYWSNTQSSIADPSLPPAVKRHVWPLYSSWDNGAGRRQFQALSPLEVFFPFNKIVRANYSPLFAVYRSDVEEGVRSRRSFLFNAIVWNRRPEEELVRLDVGPLLSYQRDREGREWEFLKGLLSYSREGDDRSFGAFWLNRPGADLPEPSEP